MVALLASGCPDDPIPVDTASGTGSTGTVTLTGDESPPSTTADTTAGSTLDTTATATSMGTATMGETESGTETDTDTGEPPGNTIVCDTVIAPAPAGEVCNVSPGGSTLLLQGRVLAGLDIYENGSVLVDTSTANGRITCVGCDCGDLPEAQGATEVACADGVISPGLINPHDHITFTLSQPVPHGLERYDHRHEWRLGLGGATELNTFPGSSSNREAILYGELRMLLGGATSISGSTTSNNAAGLLRNLDNGPTTGGLIGVDVNYSTFPLGDSNGTMLTSGCGYPGIQPPSVLNDDVYMPHIAEGITDEAENEFACLSGAPGGTDLIEGNTSVIHGIGMYATDIQLMGQEGAFLVWSPRSNIDLYGVTAEITTYRNFGVRIALGTDWTASGSMNVLRELACADAFNQQHLDGAFSDAELWLMSTYWAAGSQGADDQIGLIREGRIADITIFDGGTLSKSDTPYRAVIEANPEDVALVLRGGHPLHGDAAVVEGIVDGVDLPGCETLDVCGVDKRLCVQLDTGLTSGQITSSVNAASYPLFFCGDPDEEPSCDPARPSEFPGGPRDSDGDGIADAQDNCPNVFNPIRPLDLGGQANADGDALGDACDRCPLSPGEGCNVPDVFDQDGDGVVDLDDNCPIDANANQADGDGDGTGDVCDSCPMVANPGGGACPASVYDIKDGTIALGEAVLLEDVVVTGSGTTGFFVQVHPDDAGYQGVEFSGLFVYRGAASKPAQGDRVNVSGTVTDFFGQIQLGSAAAPAPMVLSSGNALPDPEVVNPVDIVQGGALEPELEGVLVTAVALTVTNPTPPGGPGDAMITCEFEVTGGLRVNDYFYCVSPYPTLGQGFSEITGITRWANGYTKLEPRYLADYPSTLVSFGQADSYLAVGTMGEPLPGLAVQMSAPVAADTPVDISYANPAVVTGPAVVVVPAGFDSASVSLTGVSVGVANVTATLGGVMRATSVHVYDNAQPRVPTLTPAMLAVPFNTMANLTVQLDAPAPAGGQMVGIDVAPGTCASVPPAVLVPANALSVGFTVTTLACAGNEVVTAAIGPATSDATVTVIDAPAFPNLVIVEAYYDHPGTDDLFEWVKIYNGTGGAVNLAGYSIGHGGTDYTYGVQGLAGVVNNGECFVIGGPSGNVDNGFPAGPMYGQAVDFNPDIQNSGATADGIALFNVPPAAVTAATVPIDAVIFGGMNTNGLIDETGMIAPVNVGDAPGGSSIRMRNNLTWAINPAPSPLACVPFPAP